MAIELHTIYQHKERLDEFVFVKDSHGGYTHFVLVALNGKTLEDATININVNSGRGVHMPDQMFLEKYQTNTECNIIKLSLL